MKNEIEKLNFVRDGVTRLPPGFRFQPTDEEIVFHYLKSKILHLPLPASIIPHFLNVSNFDPWKLPGDGEQERYFFTKNETKYGIGNRSTPSGYWKGTSSDKQIITSTTRINVNNVAMRGLRKTLVFYIGKPPHVTRTDWFMHEFSLTIHPMQRSSGLEDWLICHIYKKDATNANVNYSMDIDGNHNTNYASTSSSSSSSNSSGVTEVSSGDRLECNNEGDDPDNFYLQYRY